MNDLSSWVEKNAAFTPSKTAIRFEGEDIDYTRFAAMVRGHARALRAVHGVQRGDRVAFLGFNSPSMLALFFACARIGAMFSPLNWRLVAPELAYILGDSDAPAADCGCRACGAGPRGGGGLPGDRRHPREQDRPRRGDSEGRRPRPGDRAGDPLPAGLYLRHHGPSQGRDPRPAGDPGQRPQLRPLCRADRCRPHSDRAADVSCGRAQHPDLPRLLCRRDGNPAPPLRSRGGAPRDRWRSARRSWSWSRRPSRR